MPKLIKDGIEALDPWVLINEASGPEILQAVTGKNFIVPNAYAIEFNDELERYEGNIAIWLDSHETPADIKTDLQQLDLIALNFPTFADGRAYSSARELRERYGYKGELRAIGDVLRDQIFYMSRCGFNAFSLRHDQDIDACINAFGDFKTGYQTSIIEPVPLFRRR